MDIGRVGGTIGLDDEVRELILFYVQSLESGQTRDHCLCQWKEMTGLPDSERQRWARGDAHEDCPIHTKEGFIVGFLAFMSKQVTPPRMCSHDVERSGCAICLAKEAACSEKPYHGTPWRYCPVCGWAESDAA